MTAERFAESIAQIRERAAAGALLLEPDDVNYLGSLSEAFYVENDVDFLQVESRRAFINQAGRFRVGFVLNQLDMSRDDARALVRYALSSQGACIDPTFRFELETFIAEDLRARLVSIPASTEGSAYVDFSLALSEAGRVINNELWNMTPELLEGYALTPSEFNQVYEGVGGRVAFLLGTSYLTPEQTDTLLKHPAIISSEAYRVRMHMLKTPNEPIRQNSR